jgi:hypothetical protein
LTTEKLLHKVCHRMGWATFFRKLIWSSCSLYSKRSTIWVCNDVTM